MTNANTIQASKKFRNRWPFQKFLDSKMGARLVAVAVATTATSFVSFHSSTNSAPFTPTTTFCAIDPHISQILHVSNHSQNYCIAWMINTSRIEHVCKQQRPNKIILSSLLSPRNFSLNPITLKPGICQKITHACQDQGVIYGNKEYYVHLRFFNIYHDVGYVCQHEIVLNNLMYFDNNWIASRESISCSLVSSLRFRFQQLNGLII